MTTRRKPTPGAEPSCPFIRDLRVNAASVAALKPHPHNARKHSKKQVQQIAESIRVFGFTNPVLVDDDSRIVAGHGRVAAAKLLGMAEVPTIRLSNLSEAEIRAYVIADNRLAEKAGWDRELVATELQYLSDLQIELDVTVTGFDLPEIDVLIGGLDGAGAIDEADRLKPVALVADAIRDCSRRGDIVLDCFGGSGTTLIAAERTGRRGYLMEMEPRYVDVAIERYRLITGQEAIHAETGMTPALLTDWRAILGDEAASSALASA